MNVNKNKNILKNDVSSIVESNISLNSDLEIEISKELSAYLKQILSPNNDFQFNKHYKFTYMGFYLDINKMEEIINAGKNKNFEVKLGGALCKLIYEQHNHIADYFLDYGEKNNLITTTEENKQEMKESIVNMAIIYLVIGEEFKRLLEIINPNGYDMDCYYDSRLLDEIKYYTIKNSFDECVSQILKDMGLIIDLMESSELDNSHDLMIE
ncbi:hypothetical protein [Methanobrevibacter sp.]|uniref:hypothetical protein n=1 Tax=Methanobrevibacter sp. TaxID=66852 RepID=UPI002611A041|nr:hypothetical protein [uncultured Methanobrevibacter sp.]